MGRVELPLRAYETPVLPLYDIAKQSSSDEIRTRSTTVTGLRAKPLHYETIRIRLGTCVVTPKVPRAVHQHPDFFSLPTATSLSVNWSFLSYLM